jgi:succinate dehydrogenase / fumarate reductase iron-sulfur subunit
MERKDKVLLKEPQKSTVKVKIRRGTAGESWCQVYEVPYQEGDSVLGVLKFIYENLDPTLGFSDSCRIGLCTACLVRVNGQVVRACTTLIKGDILVEPYRPNHVIRDLIVDPNA